MGLLSDDDDNPPEQAASALTGSTLARKILCSEEYQDWLQHRISIQELDPGIEKMLWTYAFGKPATEVHVSGLEDLSRLSDSELRKELQQLEQQVTALTLAKTVH